MNISHSEIDGNAELWGLINFVKTNPEPFKSLNGDTIKYMRGSRWIQTTDGNDNISFDKLNKGELEE